MNQPPPGPRWLRPVEFFQAGLTPPLPVLHRLAQKFGDPFRVKYLSGAVTFTGNPDAVAEVYTANPEVFDVWGKGVIAPVFGDTSVVVTSRQQHSRDRKLLGPAFTGDRLRTYGETIGAIAAEYSRTLKPGHAFRMLTITQQITLDVMVRVVFGVQGSERIALTRKAVLELIDSLHVLIFLFPFMRRGGFGPWARHRRAVSALDHLLLEEVRGRRESPTASSDVLSLLVQARGDDGSALSEADLLDHLRGLLFAGHEATATVLAWAFYRIHRHPEILARVRQELAELGRDPLPEQFVPLPYLEAVCKETLRLYPPVVDPARIVRVPFTLGGYTVPAGEALRVSISLLHAREDIFPHPERFSPERFLNRKYSLFEFAPFGGGARRCLGSAFAMYELKIILGTILHNYHFRLGRSTPVHARRGLTLGPRGGVPMIAL